MAAILFTVLSAALVLFQISLAAGAPLGAYAWGGQHPGRLPTKLRVSSLLSVLIYLFLVLVILSRSGLVPLFPEWFQVPATWAIFAYLVLGTVMNALSKSMRERLVMTPVAAVLAVLALLVALS